MHSKYILGNFLQFNPTSFQLNLVLYQFDLLNMTQITYVQINVSEIATSSN